MLEVVSRTMFIDLLEKGRAAAAAAAAAGVMLTGCLV
jgi:hypothetical protein